MKTNAIISIALSLISFNHQLNAQQMNKIGRAHV